MATQQVAIVSLTDRTDDADVARVTAALNRQVMDDFAPTWGTSAMVHAFPPMSVPPDAWVIAIMDDIGAKDGITGFHTLDDGLPYALVEYSHSWSLTVSHELLEMLADPTGAQPVAARAPDDPPREVEYLLEICDPCQDHRFSYEVESVLVSDFITPQYYEDIVSPGTRYSFRDQISEPRTLLPGGYLSFTEPETGVAFEWKHGQLPSPLGTPVEGVSLRTWTDARTTHPDLRGVPPGCDALETARASEAAAAAQRAAFAGRLRQQIDALVNGETPDYARR